MLIILLTTHCTLFYRYCLIIQTDFSKRPVDRVKGTEVGVVLVEDEAVGEVIAPVQGQVHCRQGLDWLTRHLIYTLPFS